MIRNIYSALLLLMGFALMISAQTPVKISTAGGGNLTATKSYMQSFVENPSGTMIAYRYFESGTQPTHRDSGSTNCDLMIYNIQTGGPAFKKDDITDKELAHGSEAMVWITDNMLYYNGKLYDVSTTNVGPKWNIRNNVDNRRVRAWRGPRDGKIFVNIRNVIPGHTDYRGFYHFDASSVNSSNAPTLSPIASGFLSGIASATGIYESNILPDYIYPSPDGSKLYLVVVDSSNGNIRALISSSDGSNIQLLANSSNDSYRPWDGHTVWRNNNTLVKGNGIALDLEGDNEMDHVLSAYNISSPSLIQVGGEGNHVSISPDGNWLVGDICHEDTHPEAYKNGVYLYEYGTNVGMNIALGIERLGDYHPSFSRDGNKVYYQGIRQGDTCQSVNCIDITDIKAGTIGFDTTQAEYMRKAGAYVVDESHYGMEYWVKVNSTSSSGYLYANFKETSGSYKILTRYRDEYDGNSYFALTVNGQLKDYWYANQVTSAADDDWFVREKTVYISTGQEIRIYGSTANLDEPARIDWVKIEPPLNKNNSDVKEEVPVNYSLHQNYPNPFNPTTKISFALPQANHVTLKVYNSIGQEIRTLVNETKTAGNYEVNFDAKGLSSGVYFYRIEAGKYSESRKMIIMK